MTDDLLDRLRGYLEWREDWPSKEIPLVIDRIEQLEAALRTIDNAIPKNNPTLPAICLIAGDIAEGALNGTWPAFGVMPRAALEGKDND